MPSKCLLCPSTPQTEPLYTDALVARAHALIKTEKFEEAEKDADKAIDILRADTGSGGEAGAADQVHTVHVYSTLHKTGYTSRHNVCPSVSLSVKVSQSLPFSFSGLSQVSLI